MKQVKILSISITLIFGGCAYVNTGSIHDVKDMVNGKEDNSSKGGKYTAMQSAGVGTVLGLGAGYALGETRLGGLFGIITGRAIGNRLAKMQKDYKGQELELLMKIESVHADEENLINKNKILDSEIKELNSKIENLKKQKNLDSSKKDALYTEINIKIEDKKKSLNRLLKKNKQMKKKIAKSEAKIYQYNYKSKDKKLLQQDLKIMKRASIELRQNINSKIRELNKLKRKIA